MLQRKRERVHYKHRASGFRPTSGSCCREHSCGSSGGREQGKMEAPIEQSASVGETLVGVLIRIVEDHADQMVLAIRGGEDQAIASLIGETRLHTGCARIRF